MSPQRGASLGGRRVGTKARRIKPTAVGPFVAAAATYLETFPNNGTLGTATEDLTWFVSNSGLTVSGGICTVFGNTDAQAEHDTVSLDQYVQADWSPNPTSTSLYLVGRASGVSAPLVDSGVYFLVQETGGDSYVELAGWEPFTAPIASDTVLASPIATWRLELEGSDARGYRNGVLVLSGSGVSAIPDGHRAGFQIGGTSTIDNFGFGDL